MLFNIKREGLVMEIEGLDELINRLNLKEREMPRAISEAVNKLGNSLKERTVRKTLRS